MNSGDSSWPRKLCWLSSLDDLKSFRIYLSNSSVKGMVLIYGRGGGGQRTSEKLSKIPQQHSIVSGKNLKPTRKEATKTSYPLPKHRLSFRLTIVLKARYAVTLGHFKNQLKVSGGGGGRSPWKLPRLGIL